MNDGDSFQAALAFKCAAECIAVEWSRPSVLYRPSVRLDGNMYCALYGEDLMSGCAGFGPTMAEAMSDFDRNWTALRAPHLLEKPE